MNNRQLGSSALEVSEICLGTMTFGQQNSEPEAHAQLDRAFAAGVNFIDTAEMYPVPARAATAGRSEAIVGNWLATQSRQEVIVASKAAGPSRGLKWLRDGPLAFDLPGLRSALEASLRRLRTDYIDLYQLHWPARNQPMFGQWQYDPATEHASTPILETLQALAILVQEGKIRYFGLSNEHPWGVMEFVRLAREHNLPRPVSLQNAYNLLNRVYESGLAEVCHRENIGLLPYSPLAFGMLSGKYLADAKAAGRLTQFGDFGQRYAKINVVPAVAAYAELAHRHGLRPSQLALAFVCSRWFSASTIIGATSIAQLDENLGALAVPLPAALLAEIDDIHLRYTNPAP
ncbi:MAG: L-glyceraldehyde 3-phosphate reductase [Candidatus Accumulibacter appositus]|uniref:L-glyceraldehyde 3-phosphate reductase n=1 Tax=Candidatus Accumulibacter appositus TaxID=1454003 RepID=A0A011PPA8_9PROT|nr:aldo/keto reductase [Accumulibacter sp.]EXI78720.1 MAG: L-glyceraldehyde 3-phosphate reductase [Candidatus Accumulibacter appositus]HRF03378.1 aldo/keto reductase [Accumulibacter sp.]